MEIIVCNKPVVINYDLQDDVTLSSESMDSKYFSLNFQLGDYQIDASNEVVGRVLEEMLMAPMNFGIQFDKSEGAAYVETFVSKELMAIGYDSKVKSHIYTNIHHTVYLDELSSQKLVNILLTKSKPAIRLVLFLSADSIQQVINSDGVAGTLTFYTSDFLLFN